MDKNTNGVILTFCFVEEVAEEVKVLHRPLPLRELDLALWDSVLPQGPAVTQQERQEELPR